MHNRFQTLLDLLFRWTEQNKLLTAVRDGMVLAIPVIMTGSFSLLLKSIPIPGYQEWLAGLLGGAFLDLLTLICNATLNLISLVFLLTVSYSYGRVMDVHHKEILPIVSLCSYCAFVMSAKEGLQISQFQSNWLFDALFVSLLSSVLFVQLSALVTRKTASYGDGADTLFNQTLGHIFPGMIVIVLFALLNVVTTRCFGQQNFQLFFSSGVETLFSNLGRGLGSGLLFIFSLHLMWFFGIHGANVLDGVANNVFDAGVEINSAMLQTGQAPTEIVSKSFFDTFVLFGGCGSLLCLVAAILLCERRSNVRDLSKMAAAPVLFNINELLVYGLPIAFNPAYFLPFICTPLLFTLTSYAATAFGLVPVVSHSVEWTTPILLSGYAATGSIAGTLLQLFNFILGTLLYIPFVKYAQKRHRKTIRHNVEALTQKMIEAERTGKKPELLSRKDHLAPIAKVMANDLRRAVKAGTLTLFYQPQVRYDGRILGGEALLRWSYEGELVYPPLAIALAEEAGFADELGLGVLRQACGDLDRLNAQFGQTLLLSVNVTSNQLEAPGFTGQVWQEVGRHSFAPSQLCLELTEQTALSCAQELVDQLFSLREEGMRIVMDDFGVGHSSLMYLQNNQFDTVKLDGSLVTGLVANSRSREIISTIMTLSNSLHFDVLAEFVETPEQRETLHQLGCCYYQGYLYSPALSFDGFVAYICSNQIELSARYMVEADAGKSVTEKP